MTLLHVLQSNLIKANTDIVNICLLQTVLVGLVAWFPYQHCIICLACTNSVINACESDQIINFASAHIPSPKPSDSHIIVTLHITVQVWVYKNMED